MKLIVTISQDEDGVFISECPNIPGCVSQGDTRAEAITNIEDAIRECIAVRKELGMPLTVEVEELEVNVGCSVVEIVGSCARIRNTWMERSSAERQSYYND